MEGGHETTALHDVHRLFQSGTLAGVTDAHLLSRFVARRDEAAFEAIVVRHGPMIRGVCRQFLRDPHDVEDAFQAVLFVFVRKAGSVRVSGSLAPWFYGVAYRVASRARGNAQRRRAREADGLGFSPEAPPDDPDHDDLAPVVHEEVSRLPERYRAAVVLCYFEGLTHDRAAGQLGCPVGTVRSRLARARGLLRKRLRSRNLGEPAWFAGARWLPRPDGLSASTRSAAARVAAGRWSTGVVSATVVELAEGVLGSMISTKLNALAAAVTFGVITAGAVFFAGRAPGAGNDTVGQAVRPPTADTLIRDNQPTSFTKPYYVGDILSSVSPPGASAGERPVLDMSGLIEFLTFSVAPGTWRAQDESRSLAFREDDDPRVVGSITPFFLSTSLIVRHNAEVHDQIAKWFQMYRRARGIPNAGDEQGAAKVVEDRPAKAVSVSTAPAAGVAPDVTLLKLRAERIRGLLKNLDLEIEALTKDKDPVGPDGGAAGPPSDHESR